ncbi:MAG: DUF2147 domain-containing protein [Pseudomonadota bacterium]|nr:DUF2147 domain-containing protein [Pseudomonadota bacterium]
MQPARRTNPVRLLLPRLALAGLILALFSPCIEAQATDRPPVPADPIIGLWYTQEHDGGIEFYNCDQDICGRFYWIKDDEKNGDRSRDTKNPDPGKRQTPLCGMQFMGGFRPDGHGHYANGWIYSPHHGANFNAEMKLIDHETLELRGYMLFPFLGESQTWTRAAKLPKCAPDQKSGR